MATVLARPSPVSSSHVTNTSPTLTLMTSNIGPVQIPNKHLQTLSPGYPPILSPERASTSPPNKQLFTQGSTLLHPPDSSARISDFPPLYSIDASGLAAALKHIACQTLPEPRLVFPWLHGLHPDNHIQSGFFVAKRKALRKTPRCLRGITIVKADGNCARSRLKGALAPSELLRVGHASEPAFLETDPRDGFSVRNFQIQAGKMALVSDIIVYGDSTASEWQIHDLAKKFAQAQLRWHAREGADSEAPPFHTYVVTSPFEEFETHHPELVAIDSKGQTTGEVLDFFLRERIEMFTMSNASQIAHNVWLGPTPEASEKHNFDVLIEASDVARIPDAEMLKTTAVALKVTSQPQTLEFPSSGSLSPPSWSSSDIEAILDTCRWIHNLAQAGVGAPNDESVNGKGGNNENLNVDVRPTAPAAPASRRILIHCTDGYTESSLLALAYFMYAEGCPVHEAWLRLHCEYNRDFFAYPSDVVVLKSLQPRLLQSSPKQTQQEATDDPAWLEQMDGSLPSRILPYMYLGNLAHANNPDLLRAIGITRVLSVGEPVSWSDEEVARWGWDNLCFIDQVQDNGVDPLTDEFSRCLAFIERGRSDGKATLVHCRVGVSRSATICIAEVMQSLGLSFPRAYCFVRARRLNVIIQPHLRFSYELLKWEETQQAKRGEIVKRELEWATIAHEIALMNRPYAR